MPRDRWAVHLCSCNGALPISAKETGRLAGLDSVPTLHDALSRAGAGVFWKEAKLGADFHLVCCCSAKEAVAPALREAGIEEHKIVHLDLKRDAFWRAREPDGGNRLAARLIRSAIARTEAERPRSSLSLAVPSTVLVYTDRPEGLQLARRLADQMDVRVVLHEDAAGFDELMPGRACASLVRGKVVQVKGHLGDFRVSLRTRQAIDLDVCTRCGRCIPICHAKAITQGLRLVASKCDECGDCLRECAGIGAIRIPRDGAKEVAVGQVVAFVEEARAPKSGLHTGYHLISASGPADVDAVAFRVSRLTGGFDRPSYVSYDEKICAGGTAQLEGCGVCIDQCPYDALARVNARIRVEESTCEGCGGCVSICPTSALRFHNPSLEQIDAQLCALLASLPDEPAGGMRPVIVFHCGEKGAEALQVAGENLWPLGNNLLPVEVPCLRFVSEALIFRGFQLGASGVALFGCLDCPNGERPMLEERLALCRAALDAFGFGAERLSLVTVESSAEAYHLASAIGELGAFLEKIGPAPLPPFAGNALSPGEAGDGGFSEPGANRGMVVEAMRAFLGATGKEPGKIAGKTSLPYAEVKVRKEGCTLCAGCVFVCPTHALVMENPESAMASARTLQFNHLKCVACGMCETACPEKVVTIERGFSVSRAALSYRNLVRDEMVKCISCGREYINKRALEGILGKLMGFEGIGDTFAGGRKDLLRMCPDCRGAQAMAEVERGWTP